VAGQDAGLIGRDAELARLHGLVDPPPADSRVLLVLGEAGMGKTALLAEVARQAASSGLRVLSTAGRESERDLAFAGLHQLLRPVLDRVAALPDRQAKALLSALALAADPVPPDALLTGIAVLTLLSTTRSRSPSAPRPTCGSPTGCVTSRTAAPGTWRPPRWNRTSASPRCSSRRRPRRSAAVAPPPRPGPSSGPPSSARRSRIRAGGCWPRPPWRCRPGRRTGCGNWPPGRSRSPPNR
jgi:hypothetical protein